MSSNSQSCNLVPSFFRCLLVGFWLPSWPSFAATIDRKYCGLKTLLILTLDWDHSQMYLKAHLTIAEESLVLAACSLFLSMSLVVHRGACILYGTEITRLFQLKYRVELRIVPQSFTK